MKYASGLPNESSFSRSSGCESFWFRMLAVPSSIDRLESPIGPSLGARSGRDHEPQRSALDHLARLRVRDVVVAQGAEIGLQVVGRVVRQQHLDVLRHIRLEQPRVEVVAVPVRDVEEVGLAVLLPVERPVVGEREPRSVERGLHPRVAEDASARRLDEHAGMAESCDAHGFLPCRQLSSLRCGAAADLARGADCSRIQASKRPRMSSAVSACENSASSSMTARNRRALRCCRAITFSSIVPLAMSR